MNIPQIQNKLEELFQEHRIVFWNDAEGEFEESIKDLGLNGVELIRPDKEGQFKTKIALELEKPKQKFLVYSAESAPNYADDWLLDIRLYSYEFSADRASVLLDELGLKNHHLRDYLKTRKKFFGSKARQSSLKKLINPEDTSNDIDRKMLAVIAKSEHDDIFYIIQSIYNYMGDAHSLDELPEVWGQVVKLDLQESFWGFVKDTFGYSDENPTLRNLLTSLLVTDLANSMGDALPDSLRHFVLPYAYQSNIVVCLGQWRDSSSKGLSYDHLSILVSEALNLEDQLSGIKLDKLIETETFLEAEQETARKLRDRVIQTSDAINAEDIIRISQKRQDKHWANTRLSDSPEIPRKALYSVYEGIINAAEFFELKNTYSDGFNHKTAKDLYNAYCNEIYRFDQLYRLFCEHANIAESQGWGLLKDLQVKVEAAYCNWYLESLALRWGQLVEPESWKIEGVDNQYNFYKRYLSGVAGKKTSRGTVTGYVIISDAFRYEAAEELTRELNGKYRFVAGLKQMLGVLPSYTSLGMGALLPHNKLEYSENGDVLIDGQPCASLQQRADILAKYNGTAIKAQELIALKKDEGREFARDKDIVYIYHNTIDAMGDSASTENQTVNAVRKAINELTDLVRYIINNLNGSKIFITADHGFLYTNTKPDEIDKNKLYIKPDSAIKKHKRYLIGDNLPYIDDSYSGKLSVTSGVDPNSDMGFVLPKGLSLFYFTGGARFVHGGMSLQEVVVPVVVAGAVRGKAAQKTKERKVGVQVLGSNFKVTTNRHRFQLLQTDAVSERVKPLTVKIAIYDSEKAVTSIESVTFDSSSNSIEDRSKWITLSLQNIDYDREKTYRLILRDSETGIEIQSIEVRVDRAFTNDF